MFSKISIRGLVHLYVLCRHYVYQLDTGLGTKPQDVILRRGDLSKELNEVCDEALRSLNGGPERFKVSPTYRFTSEDFLHGMSGI